MKRNKIFYWVTTGLVAAGMLLGGVMHLVRDTELLETYKSLGIPLYLVGLLGISKLLGAVVLVAPVWDKLKEWAYAGFAFIFIGAIWTHVATGTPWVGPLLFLVVLGASYIFRLRIRDAN